MQIIIINWVSFNSSIIKKPLKKCIIVYYSSTKYKVNDVIFENMFGLLELLYMSRGFISNDIIVIYIKTYYIMVYNKNNHQDKRVLTENPVEQYMYGRTRFTSKYTYTAIPIIITVFIVTYSKIPHFQLAQSDTAMLPFTLIFYNISFSIIL